MVEAVFFSVAFPLVFLAIILKSEGRRPILFLLWGITSAWFGYYANTFIFERLGMEKAAFSTRIVPLVEELLKALPLLYFLFQKKEGRGNYSIVRYALAAGIGFSILENYYYLTSYLQSGVSGVLAFIIVRSLSAALLHGVLAALTGYAVQQMILYGFFSLSLLAGSYGIAVLIHSVYNLLAQTPELQMSCILIPAALFLLEILGWNLFGLKSARMLEGAKRDS
jgi:RsiW-degrading membrane proteinase PrsW (M82 family)